MAAGYGVDTWCLDSVQTGRLARGPMLVAQAIYRRFITPRGALRGGDEESAYGLDVSAYIGAVGAATAVAALPGLMRAEALKDQRVSDAQAQVAAVTSADGLTTITIALHVTLYDSDDDFTLTLGINSVTVTVLGVRTS